MKDSFKKLILTKKADDTKSIKNHPACKGLAVNPDKHPSSFIAFFDRFFGFY